MTQPINPGWEPPEGTPKDSSAALPSQGLPEGSLGSSDLTSVAAQPPVWRKVHPLTPLTQMGNPGGTGGGYLFATRLDT